jgi:hypothetical protein
VERVTPQFQPVTSGASLADKFARNYSALPMGPDGLKSGRDHKTGPYLHAHRAFSPAAGRGCRDGQQKCVTSKHATLDRPLSIQLTIVQLGTSSGKETENLLSGKSNHFELAIASMVQGDTPLSLLLLFRLPHFLLSARGLILGH